MSRICRIFRVRLKRRQPARRAEEIEASITIDNLIFVLFVFFVVSFFPHYLTGLIMRAKIKWINSVKAGMGLVCFAMLTLVVSSQPLKWNEPAQITKQNFSIKLPELGSKQYEDSVIDIPSSKLS